MSVPLLGRTSGDHEQPLRRRWRQILTAPLGPRALAYDGVWIALGLLITIAAAWRIVATPGELGRWDTEYPIASEFWIRRFTHAWDTSYASGLEYLSRTYTDAPWGLVAQGLGLSMEVAGKFHWLSWHLLGFLAGYVGARLLLGPEIRTQHPVAVRIGLLLAGLFWALNPWSLGRWGQLHIHVSAVMLPIFVGLVVSATSARDSRSRAQRALAAAAVLALAVSASPHYMAVGVLTGLGWMAYAFVTTRGRRRSVARTAMVFAMGYAVFAAFTLVPYFAADIAGSQTGPGYLVGGGVAGLAGSSQSLSNTLALTGHEGWHWFFRPLDSSALAGWRLASFVPAGLLAVALVRLPSHRHVLGFAAILGGVTALYQIATYADVTRPMYQTVVAEVPFGWALRVPDKLSGVLALAYLPGIALAPVVFARSWPRRWRLVGACQTGALALALTVYLLPGIAWALLDENAQHSPEPFPDSLYGVPAEIDRRNAAESTRTLLAIWDQRLPEWSTQDRILPVIEQLAVTTPFALGDLPVGKHLVAVVESDDPNVSDVLRAHGVARVLVATDTPRGRDLAERLRRTDGLQPDFAEGYHEVFRTVDPPFPWVYEETAAGRVELPWRREGMHRLVVDVPPGLGEPREIVTQEHWDPLWTAQLPSHEAAVKRSDLGLLSVRLEPGAAGPLVLEFSLQRALIAGHAITWAGLLAWAVWAAWPRLRRRLTGHP